MSFQLTREADYAIRTMLEVACHPYGTPTTTAEVAARRLVPRPFVRKIVRRLTSAGLLRTRRGSRGGLMLSRPASRIHLLAIMDAAQGPISINECVLRPETCALQLTCPVHEVCQSAREQLTRLFGGVSLSDLAQRGAELEQREARVASHAEGNGKLRNQSQEPDPRAT